MKRQAAGVSSLAAATAAVFVLGLLQCQTASASVVCPDSCDVVVDFTCRFTGVYRTGLLKDVVTITPGPGGETLAENGIRIRAYLRDCAGRPMVGVPADSVFLTSNSLCVCPGGTSADGPTDSLGYTTFTGALRAGGCADKLYLVVGCAMVAEIPVKTNSPDTHFIDCRVDAGGEDDHAFRFYLSPNGTYSLCSDFNEDGHVDAADYAQLISRYWGHQCAWREPPCPRLEFLPGRKP